MPLYQTPAQRTVVNAKTDYGAKGDAKTVTDGAMTNASATLTSATAAFTVNDVGKQVSVMSASSTSMRYSGRIVSITNATTVVVAPAPTLTTTAQTLVVDQSRSVADGVTTANSTTVTSATAAFTAADVGKQITVTTAAATALNTTISAFTNSTTVTLAASATRTCSAVQVVYGTDDTTAIQNALNFVAITTNPFTTVYLPEGMYLTQQSASGLGGLTIYSNSTICGDGWATIIRAVGGASSVASGLLEINPWDAGSSDPSQNQRNITIRDLQFQGTTQEDGFLQGMECITMAAATDVQIRNCKFYNMRSDGVYLGNGTHVATGERHNQRIKILDCVFDGVNWENRNALSVLDCDDFLCDGCSFWYSSRSDMPGAIDFEPNIQAANPIVRGLTVSNCHFWYCGGNSGHVGIALAKSQLQYVTPQRGLQIIGNSFYHGAGGQMGLFFIQIQYPQESTPRNDVIVADNHFFGGGGYAMEIDGMKGVDIHDNVFEDFQFGFALGYQAKSLDIFCHDNVFKDCGLAGGNFFEIDNCDRLEFNHNLIDNCGASDGTQGIIVGFKNGGACNQPSSIVATPSTTGGTLGAATRSYRLTTTKDGPSETLATTAVTAVTTGTTASVVLTWVPDNFGNGTKVYGRTGGSELLMATLGPEVGTFTDTGSVTPSGALPGADTSAHGSSNGVRFTNNIVQQGAGVNHITKMALLTANHNTVYANLLYRDNTVPTGTPSTAITPFTETTLPFKASVRAASTANISIPPGGTTLTVDGVTMVNGDRLLLKDQSTPAQNGVYVVGGIGTSVILTRSLDANVPGTVYDLKVGVGEGTLNAGTEWNQQSPQPITVDTTALRFTREWPPYQTAMRHPWDVGSTPPLIANMRRQDATASLVLPTSATTLLSGGLVLPAGLTVSNINMFVTAAGATLTIHWLAIVRQSDRLVLAHTANSTTTPTISTILTRALTSALVVQSDTPVWIAHAFAATTGSAFAGTPAGQAVLNFQTPIMFGNSSTTPTTTVPTDNSTILGAPAAGATQGILYWLT